MKILASGLDDTTVAFLRENGVAVEAEMFEEAAELVNWLRDDFYDAAVIALEASGLGIYAARGLRARKIVTPLIGLSSGSGERYWSDHRAMFLENGGDDLLLEPVNPRELVATLRATTRRFKGSLLDVYECRLGDAHLKVNLTMRSAQINGIPLSLTDKENTFLMLFASSPGRVWSKEMLMTQIYVEGIDDEPDIKIIDVFVCKLRKKLAEIHPDAEKFVETVWGRGYRLTSDSRQAATTQTHVA